MKNYVELYGSNERSLSPLERKALDTSAPQIDIERVQRFDPSVTTDKLNLSVPGTYWYQMIINELVGLYEERADHLDLLSFSTLFNVLQTRITHEIISLRPPLGVTGVVLTPGIQSCVVRWTPSISTNVKGYRITWWEDATPHIRMSHEQSSDVPTIYTIADLTPATIVHVQIESYRKFDEQYPNVYSIPSYHQTKILLGRVDDFETPDPITDLEATPGPGGDVKLTWNTPLDYSISHASLLVGKVNKDGTVETFSERYIPLSDLIIGGANEETVFHLAHNQTFRFEITLYNVYGNKSESRYVEAVPDAAAPDPAYFTREDVTKDSIILGWSATDADDFDKYRIRVYENTGNKLVNTVDITTSIDIANTRPRDIWSDGTTMWVVNSNGTDSKVFAYDLATKAYDADSSFDLNSANSDPWGLAKFGDYFYVSDLTDDKLYAYVATTGSDFGNYNSDHDIDLDAYGNDSPLGMIVVGSSLFVIDDYDDTIYEYDSSGSNSSEIDLDSVNLSPTGIWANATTRWVAEADANDLNLYAYTVSTGSRDSSKDINLDSNNSSPAGIWSDDTTIWVVNINDSKIYAYTLSSGARDQSSDFNSLGNLLTLGIEEDDSTDPYAILKQNVDYYFDLTVLDEIGNESSPPARSITLIIDSDPPLPLTTYDVTFMDPDTTTYTTFVSDQREFNASWTWPQTIIDDSGSLIIRIRDGSNVDRTSDTDAPPFKAAFVLAEVNFDYHSQDGGYYEYIISSQIDPLTNNRKSSYKVTMSPSEAIWQRRLSTQLIYGFEFYLVDKAGNESSAAKINVGPDYGAPGAATSLSLEPVINFIHPELLGTIDIDSSNQTLPKELITSATEDQELETIVGTTSKIELRLTDRDLSWSLSLDSYWFRLLDSSDNEIAVLNLGGHAEYNDPALVDFSGVNEDGNYLLWTDPAITEDPDSIEIYYYPVHSDSYALVKRDLINSKHRQYGYEYGFTWPSGLIESGSKEGAEVSIKISGKYRNYTYNTGNSINIGTNNATDATSDSKVLWILNTSGTGGNAVAYRIDTKVRYSSRDIEFEGISPKGIYADGIVMWVLKTEGSNQIIAFDMFGNRITGSSSTTYPLDFNLLHGNADPSLLCGDGTTLWICDNTDNKLYAYTLSTGFADSTKDINLHSNNANPVGMTTDGTTIWVADSVDDLVYAYTINSSNGTRDTASELTMDSTVTLGAIWTDAVTFWVTDTADNKLLEYSSGVFIDRFNEPREAADTISTTKLATEVILNPIKFTVGQDGTTDIYGYDHSGTKTVGSVDLAYNLLPGALFDFDSIDFVIEYVGSITTLSANQNTNPKGTWSDGTMLWIIDSTDDKIYAYDLYSGTADNTRDFTALNSAGNTNPTDLWSDGVIMWVSDEYGRIYAYSMVDGNRVTSKEFSSTDLTSTNTRASGIWSDGTTMWVSDQNAGQIFAYDLDTKARDQSKEFTTLSDAGNDYPSAIWSDGVTMWVCDDDYGQIYAYKMSDKSRDTNKELSTSDFTSGHSSIVGIWSDGKTMYITDDVDATIYIYNYWGNIVKRFVTDATGSDYYLEFQDNMNSGMQFSHDSYGNQYSDLRAEIINESSKYAVNHNYSFMLGGQDGSGLSSDYLPKSITAPKDYRKQISDGAGTFADGDEVRVNFYSSEITGEGTVERGFYWLTSGSSGDTAEIKVKVLDKYGNFTTATTTYTPPTAINPVTSVASDQEFESIVEGQPVRAKVVWTNPAVTDSNGDTVYQMHLEYYYKKFTGGSGDSLSGQTAPTVSESDWLIVPGGPNIEEIIVSRPWDLDITERNNRKWRFGIRVRDAFNNVSTTVTEDITLAVSSELVAIDDADITITSGHSSFKIEWINPATPTLYRVKLKYTVNSVDTEVTMASSGSINQTGNREQEYTLDLTTSVTDLTGYSFTIIIVDLFNNTAETTKTGTFDLDRTGPSAPVLDSVGNDSPGEITLNYTPSSDADAYSKLRYSRQELDSSDNLVSGTLVYTELTSSGSTFTLTVLKKYRLILYAYDEPFDATSYARRNGTAATTVYDLYIADNPAAVSALTEEADQTAHDSITVSWGSYTGWKDGGGTTNRKFMLRRSATGNTWEDWVDVSHTATSYEFTGLVYGTSYKFEIKVVNDAGFESTATQSASITTVNVANPILTNNQSLSGVIIPINTNNDITIEAALNVTWDPLSESNWAGGAKPVDENGNYRTYDIMVSGDSGNFWTVFPALNAYIDLGNDNYADRDSYRVTQIYANKSQFKVKMVSGSGSNYGLSDNRDIVTADESITNLPEDFFISNSDVIILINKSNRLVYGYHSTDGSPSVNNDFKLDSTNTNPIDIYSDNTTIWVLDTGLDKILAYHANTYARDSAKDITLDAGNSNPLGMDSDGTTLWVTDSSKLYAYILSSRARSASDDITLNGSNSNPSHLTVGDSILWVADEGSTKKLFAYDLTSGSTYGDYKSGDSITLHSNSIDIAGLANDGTTIWVVSDDSNYVYAYAISSGNRDQDKEFDVDISDTLTITGLHWLTTSEVTSFYFDNSGTNSKLLADFSGYSQLQDLDWDDYDLYGIQVTQSDGTILYDKVLDKSVTGVNTSGLWQTELDSKLSITADEILYITFYKFSDFDNIGDDDHTIKLSASNGSLASSTDNISVDDVKIPDKPHNFFVESGPNAGELTVYYEYPDNWNDGGVLDASRFIKLTDSDSETIYLHSEGTLLDTVTIAVGNSGSNYGYYSGSYGTLDSADNSLPGELFTDGASKTVDRLYDGGTNTLTLVHESGTLESTDVLKRYSVLVRNSDDETLVRFNLGGDGESATPTIDDANNSYTLTLTKFADLFSDVNSESIDFEIYSLPTFIIRRDPSLSDLTKLSTHSITAYGQSSESALTTGLSVQSGTMSDLTIGVPTIIPANLSVNEYLVDQVSSYKLSLVVTWDALTDSQWNGGNSSTRFYELRYRELDTGSWTADLKLDSRNTDYAINDLSPGKQYEIQIRAINGTDNTYWSFSRVSNSINIPEVAEFSITAAQTTETSISLEWNTLALWNDNDANTESRGFEFEWRPEGDAYWSGKKLDEAITLPNVGKKNNYQYGFGSDYTGSTESGISLPSDLFDGDPGTQSLTEISTYYELGSISDPIGVCSDGTTMWAVSDSDNSKLYGYDVSTKDRNSSKDITLDSNNDDPKDICTNGTILWVVDATDKKLYAYTISTGAYTSASDFNTLDAANNDNPISAWTDGIIMYVLDSVDKRIYAYTVTSKARISTKDITTLGAAGNDNPAGIWSDGNTMWVSDSEDSKLYAYKLDSGDRVSTKDFETLVDNDNDDPHGIWSDGTTMWVCDPTNLKIFAYNLPMPDLFDRVLSSDITLDSSNTSASYVCNDGTTLWVLDTGSTKKLFAYTLSTGARDSDKDLTLASANSDPVGIGTDGSIMWVADNTASTIFAYKLYAGTAVALGTRDADKDIDTLNDATNNNATGLWSDGETIWVGDYNDSMLYAYNLITKQRDTSKEFTTLAGANNHHPIGIWSDGETMWVSDLSDDKLYAYNMSTKARDSAKDFNTLNAANNNHPRGIWSDETTMWVADSTDDKVYAYNMSTKAREPSQDFTTLSAASNNNPRGLYSDGTTMWICDYDDDTLYAYNLSTKARDSSKDFDTLGAATNNKPYGIWSDGETMWVSDNADAKIYAYVLESGNRASESDIDLDSDNSDVTGIWCGSGLVWVADDTDNQIYTYNLYGDKSLMEGEYITASKLNAAGNEDPRGIWSNGAIMWVVDSTDSKAYAYNLGYNSENTDLVFDFNSDNSDPIGMTGLDDVVWVLDGTDNKLYAYLISTALDFDSSILGDRKADLDFDDLSSSGNTNPNAIWSNGTTMWVSDYENSKIYAYKVSDTLRDSSKDFNALAIAGNTNPYGMWSDETTMWVSDSGENKIYAYKMSDRTRDAGKDFDTLSAAGNTDPRGIWSDETTMWVVDGASDKIYAYNLSSKARDQGKDFDTLSAAGNNDPTGIWSDETTMWVADNGDNKLYAYKMSDKSRDPVKDISILAETNNADPKGIWSDGETMWVVDDADDKIYAYTMQIRDSDNDYDDFDVSRRNNLTGTWSNDTTIWICDYDDAVIYAYNLDDMSRDEAKDITTLKDAGNEHPRDIWSDGNTMWVSDEEEDKLYAYVLATGGEHLYSEDFNTLSAAGNSNSHGIWSNETTMWISDVTDDKLYAYNMSDKSRNSSEDFSSLNSNNIAPYGIWSNGTTMWVADGGADKIYAYNMSNKSYNSSEDFNTLSGAGVNNPTGIWSDGTTMWVADWVDEKIYAFNMATKSRDNSEEFDTLSDAGNASPFGIWSDGTTMWVSDRDDDKIYAYNMEDKSYDPDKDINSLTAAHNLSPAAIHGINGIIYAVDSNESKLFAYDIETRTRRTAYDYTNIGDRDSAKDFDTLSAAGNTSPAGIWSNGVTMWVVDNAGDKVYAYNMSDKSRDADKDIDTLADAGNEDPYGIWSNDNIIWIGDITDDKIYAYNLLVPTRNSDKDFDTLDTANNNDPTGMWSNGTTMWVADYTDKKIYAYNMSDMSRNSGQDFNTLDAAGNDHPYGIWSNDTIMWVADYEDKKIYAYNMSTKSRSSSNDFNTLDAAGNDNPRGIWSDGTTMWVSDSSDDKIYAYNMDDKSRDQGNDFTILDFAGNVDPRCIWSDGVTMWVVDEVKSKAFAYDLITKERDSHKDFNTFSASGNTTPRGLWSDGEIIWVNDSTDDKIYAYTKYPMTRNSTKDITTLDEAGDAKPYGIWSDGVNLWVVDNEDNKLYAYHVLGFGDRNPDEDFEALSNSENTAPRGMWSDGETMWVADGSDDKIYAYHMDDKAHDNAKDFDTLSAAGNTDPRDIWSNGTIMWVCDSGADKIYAYNMSDMSRNSDEDFDTLSAANNNDIRGIWSDGTTMWVSDSADDKLYAYNMDDKSRNSSEDFDNLDDDNDNPHGLYSDGETMWVVDPDADKVFAYKISDKSRDPYKDIETLSAAGNTNPYGIWSDGMSVWVSDQSDNELYAYSMVGLMSRDMDKDFDTLEDATNEEPRGIWSDGTTMWVVDTSDDKIYAYNMSDMSRNSSEDFDTLSAANNNNPIGIWSNGTIMWVSDSVDGKIYAYNMSTKARSASDDFNTLDSDNSNPLGIYSDGTTMWVANNASGSSSNDKIFAYKISDKGRDSGKDFNTLNSAGNNNPYGIWSDGTIMWVSDRDDEKLYAYRIADKSRYSDEDFIGLGTLYNDDIRCMWSDGETMWVSDSTDNKIYAYRMSREGERAEDFDSDDLSYLGNSDPKGVYSNGTITWVADHTAGKIFAYNVSDKSRDESENFDLSAAYRTNLTGTWSNGEIIWICDYNDAKIYAYNLDDMSRDEDKDFYTLIDAGNEHPRDIWSDGNTMWVSDDDDEKLYAYVLSTGSDNVSSKDFDTLSAATNNLPI